MELLDILQSITQNAIKGAQLCDMRVGVVTSVTPLKIQIDPSMPDIEKQSLILTNGVIEKKIVFPYETETYCIENEETLPKTDTEITINRGLTNGEKVLLLRVSNGTQFIVLSRIYD